MSIAIIRQRATDHAFAHLGEPVETVTGPVQVIVQRHDRPDVLFKGGRRAVDAGLQYLIIHVREQDADSITGTVRIDGRDWQPVERTRHAVQPGVVQIELAPVDGHGEEGGQWL
ncbi:hypothetical protein [Sulfurivirga sp.]|uniref:hypothetical protein n=1 Tax=Sulfurivirga sp. TaxID=2614236 RepID=UPI0025EF5EBF|nr:hypothetical protein [Sulfurivirga sp.]